MIHDNVMIDLETLGTKPGSVILSIGAVAFVEGEPEGAWQRFDSGPINIKNSRVYGLTVDEGTLAWWLEQEPAARALLQECLRPTAVDLPTVLGHLSRWFPLGATVWGNGANFDGVLLRAAFEAVSITCPWPYYDEQCYRTMKNLFSSVARPPFHGVKHDALTDALHQTRHLQAILAHIKAVR